MQVRRIGRWLALAAAVIVLVPAMADARAGAGSSSGSRGSRTNQAPPPTQTAPTAKPVERSVTPQAPAQQPSMASLPAANARPGFFARNPFLSGLMGGLVGAGLLGMLFGGGFGGAAGMGGLLVQRLLIGGLGYLAVRLFRGWSARNAAAGPPAYAYAAPAAMLEQPAPRASGALLGGAPLLMGRVFARSPRSASRLLETSVRPARTPRRCATRDARKWSLFHESSQPTRAAEREQGRGNQAQQGDLLTWAKPASTRDRRHALQHDHVTRRLTDGTRSNDMSDRSDGSGPPAAAATVDLSAIQRA